MMLNVDYVHLKKILDTISKLPHADRVYLMPYTKIVENGDEWNVWGIIVDDETKTYQYTSYMASSVCKEAGNVWCSNKGRQAIL